MATNNLAYSTRGVYTECVGASARLLGIAFTGGAAEALFNFAIEEVVAPALFGRDAYGIR